MVFIEAFIKNVMYTTTMVMMKRTYSSITDDEVSEKVKTNLNDFYNLPIRVRP